MAYGLSTTTVAMSAAVFFYLVDWSNAILDAKFKVKSLSFCCFLFRKRKRKRRKEKLFRFEFD